MKQGFLKFSDERNKRFSIKTWVGFHNGKKVVYKYPVYKEGMEHIQHIFDSQKPLKTYFPDVEVCTAKKAGDKLEFEFVEGDLLLDCYEKALKNHNAAEYEKLLLFHKSIICGSKENQCDFQVSDAFQEWFGSADAYKGAQGMVYSNFDAIAGNVIIRDNKPVFIDYEWTMDFVMPKDLVIYHCIYDAYLHYPELEAFYPISKVLEYLGISSKREDLEAGYRHFYDFVICDEQGRSYGKDKYQCLKTVFKTEHILEEWEKCANQWKAAIKANEQTNKELEHAREEWEMCATEWKNAVKANAELDQKLQHVCGEHTKSLETINNLNAEYGFLQEQYDELQTQYQNVINSRWWRLRNKIKGVKE